MARSSYIYTVQKPDGSIAGAFTVKHELADWLERNGRQFLITRVRDGVGTQQPWMKFEGIVQLNPETLEPAI